MKKVKCAIWKCVLAALVVSVVTGVVTFNLMEDLRERQKTTEANKKDGCSRISQAIGAPYDNGIYGVDEHGNDICKVYVRSSVWENAIIIPILPGDSERFSNTMQVVQHIVYGVTREQENAKALEKAKKKEKKK